MLNWIRGYWRRHIHRLDRMFLGRAIEKTAQREGTPPGYRDFAWAVHKLNDPNYGPEDFTEGERAALKTYYAEKENA
jgi:hypothetical protein